MFYIACILSTIFLMAETQHNNPLAFSTHGIVILLDDQELWSFKSDPLNKPQGQTLQAITNAILQAVGSERFPIILTKKNYCILRLLQLYGDYFINNNNDSLIEIEKSLLETTPYLNAFRLSSATQNELQLGILQLNAIINEYSLSQRWIKRFTDRTDPILKAHYGALTILGGYYNFIPNNWHICQINNSLILLMPKKIYASDTQSGIALSSFTDISNKPLNLVAREALSPEIDMVSGIQKSFVPNTSYNDNQAPTWTIYMNGHGNNKPPVYALLTPENLVTLIKNLNLTISLKLFTLGACYLKENVTNQLEEILKNAFENTRYSPITSILAFGGISESFSGNISSMVFTNIFKINIYGKSFVIRTLLNDYDAFFSDLGSGNPIDFEETLNKVFIFKSPKGTLFPFNIPMLRFPSNEFFTPLQAPSLIASIGSTLANTRKPNETLSINSFFRHAKSDCPHLPKILLLYTPVVPFFLEFKKCDNDSFPLILSMINKKITLLRGLILDNFDPDTILKSLFSLQEEDKAYLFEEIFVKNEQRYSKVVVIKSSKFFHGYKRGIYFQNQQGQTIQYIHNGDGTWSMEVTPREPFTDLLKHFQSNQITSMITPSQIQEIGESLSKKKAIQTQEMIKMVSNNFAVVSQLL